MRNACTFSADHDTNLIMAVSVIENNPTVAVADYLFKSCRFVVSHYNSNDAGSDDSLF